MFCWSRIVFNICVLNLSTYIPYNQQEINKTKKWWEYRPVIEHPWFHTQYQQTNKNNTLTLIGLSLFFFSGHLCFLFFSCYWSSLYDPWLGNGSVLLLQLFRYPLSSKWENRWGSLYIWGVLLANLLAHKDGGKKGHVQNCSSVNSRLNFRPASDSLQHTVCASRMYIKRKKKKRIYF